MGRTRNTAQKAAVLSAVTRAPHHPTAAWIYEQVRGEIPGISLGTVYRVLAGLCSEGMIKEHPQVEGPALYDANTVTHFHVRCTVCGRIGDVPADVVPANLVERAQLASHFALVSGVRVEFSGKCRECGQTS